MPARSMTPWCGTVTLTAPNVAYQLSALIAAKANPPVPPGSGVYRAQFLSLQVDVAAGGANVYIGNDDVTATGPNCGAEMVASQISATFNMGANLVNLNDIYLLSDTEGAKVNVMFITR